MKNLIKIWKNKNKILEGVKNSVFKKEHIEAIATARMAICYECDLLDREGSTCLISGTQPCCSMCGCNINFKTRSLSSSCGDEDNPRWHAVLSEKEEDALKESIDYQEPNQNNNGNSIQSKES